MVVCKFFLQGNCRYGDNCRNEHPRSNSFGNQNRFAPLQNTGNRFGSGNDVRKDSMHWNITTTDVQNDLTGGKSRPNWILTTYGPGRGAPASLLEGNEYSSEEVRVRFYELAGNGKQAEADQEAIALWSKADQAMKDVANNANNVLKFMEDAEKKHPNRYDFCKMDGSKTRDQVAKDAETQSSSQPSSAFGTTNAFGQNSSSSTNPFSKPATATFGQSSGTSAFGSNTLGKPATPSFGQSGFGGTSGQTSNTGAFGLSTAFGKPAFGSTGFGLPSFGQAAQTSSTFGQGSSPTPNVGQPSFGQPGFGSSGFGQAAQKSPFAAPSATSGFGQSSGTFGQPARSNSLFGQSSQTNTGFGQPSQTTSAFGQPSQTESTFGKSNQPTSAFGQPSQIISAFGQPSQPSAFGKLAFVQPSQPSTAFGQPSQPLSTAFGQPSQPGTSTFGQSGQTSTFGSISPAPTFGSTSNVTGTFGQNNETRASPFAASTAPTEPNDQAMETTSATDLRPVSRGTPFAAPATAFGATNIAVSEQRNSLTTITGQVNNNSTSTPHPLTGRPPKPLHYTQTLPSQPNQTNMSKQLTSYRGRRVQYIDGVPCYERPDRAGWEKIWFPEGGSTADVVALNKPEKLEDLQAKTIQYTDVVKEAYKFLLDDGRFKDGKIPLLPPMHDWCVYDF